MHEEYKKDIENKKGGLLKEHRPAGSRKEIDFVDSSVDPIRVYELKLNNTNSIAKGKRQVDQYIELLKKDPEFQGREFIGLIEVY